MATLPPSADPPAPGAAAPPPAPPMQRPVGVTLLAVLAAIGAALLLLAALAAFAFTGLAGAAGGDAGGVLAVFGAAAGVVLLLLAALYAVVAFGLFTRRRWAWYLAMVGAGLQVLSGLLSLFTLEVVTAVVSLAIGGLVAWYLLSPAVQAWFGVGYRTPWRDGGAAT